MYWSCILTGPIYRLERENFTGRHCCLLTQQNFCRLHLLYRGKCCVSCIITLIKTEKLWVDQISCLFFLNFPSVLHLHLHLHHHLMQRREWLSSQSFSGPPTSAESKAWIITSHYHSSSHSAWQAYVSDGASICTAKAKWFWKSCVRNMAVV